MLIEDYGLIGDLRVRRAGRSDGLHRLAVPAPLRLRRRASRRCSATSGMAAGSWRRRVRCARPRAATARRHADLGDRLRDRRRCGADHRLHATARPGPPRLMRIVLGLRGRVPMRMDMSMRPDYGSINPWTELVPDGAVATAGPDAFRLSTPLPLDVRGRDRQRRLRGRRGRPRAAHAVVAPLLRTGALPVEDADSALARTEAWWREWAARCSYDGPYARGRDEFADRAQGDDLRADRRDGRRADHLAARGRSAASATGTTATAGCATRRSRWKRCSPPVTPTRRWPSATSCCAPAPAIRRRARSCTGSAGSAA